MSGYGKWVGGAIGWALGGYIGGILGYQVGKFFSSGVQVGERNQGGTRSGDLPCLLWYLVQLS